MKTLREKIVEILEAQQDGHTEKDYQYSLNKTTDQIFSLFEAEKKNCQKEKERMLEIIKRAELKMMKEEKKKMKYTIVDGDIEIPKSRESSF